MSNFKMLVDPDHIIEAIKSFIDWNAGDEATERLLISLGAEIFDVSEDKFMEVLQMRNCGILVGDYVKLNPERIAWNGMDESTEQKLNLEYIRANPDKVYKVAGILESVSAPIVVDDETLKGTSFYEEECELIRNDFCDDAEKMRDFWNLSKKEFLASYSYLTEAEYDLTANKVRGGRYAVVVSYNFDSDCYCKLFNNRKEAWDYAFKDACNEYSIDQNENEWDSDIEGRGEDGIIRIICHFGDHDDVTTWQLVPVSERR